MSFNPYELLTVYGASDNEDDDDDSEPGRGPTNQGNMWTEDQLKDLADEDLAESWCHLTADNCRATFPSKQGPTRICGNLRSKCTRKDHKKASTVRGEPGLYAALTPLTVNSKVDGRLGSYKSVADMTTELRATEARLRTQMEDLAASPGYHEVNASANRAGHTLDIEQPPEDMQYPELDLITNRMEDALARATADALASPQPTKLRTRAGARVGWDLPDEYEDSKPPALTTTTAAAKDKYRHSDERLATPSPLGGPLQEASGSGHPVDELAWLQARVVEHEARMEAEEEARLQQQVDDSYMTQHHTNDQLDEPPPTMHVQPDLAALEAHLRAYRSEAEKRLVDNAEEARHQVELTAARTNTMTNQLAQQEKHHASTQQAGLIAAHKASNQQGLVTGQAGMRKAPPHEVAAKQQMAALKAQIAALEASSGQNPRAGTSAANTPAILTSSQQGDEAVNMLMAKIANLKMKNASQANPSRTINFAGGDPNAGATPADPRIAHLQVQYAELLANSLATNRQGLHQPPPVVQIDPVVDQLSKMVADLEARLQQQNSNQRPVNNETLSPEGVRIAELEAMVRSLLHMNTSGRTTGTGSGQDSVRPSTVTSGNPGGSMGLAVAGLATFDDNLDSSTAPGCFTLADIVVTKKDLSVGDEIHGISLRMPKQVLQALCPKGLTETTRSQISEAGLDVASLPGKYRSSAAMDITEVHEAIANTLGQAMEIVQNRQGNQRARDLNFQSEKRNALDTIKNHEQLLSFKEELDETCDEALISSENMMRTILEDVGVDVAATDYYITASQFPAIIKKTLEFYKALVDHVVGLSTKYGFGNAKLDLEHYAHKLQIRRKGSLTRLEVIFKVYCDLRDGQRNKFIDSKLQQKKNAKFLESMHPTFAPKSPNVTPAAGVGETPARPTPTPTPVRPCRRCGTKLHPTTTNCPLYHVDVPPVEARRMARECKDESDFVAAAKAAVTKFLASKGTEGTSAKTVQ